MQPTITREQQKQAAELRALLLALKSAIETANLDSADLQVAGDTYINALIKAISSYNETELLAEIIRDKGTQLEVDKIERPKPLDLSAFTDKAVSQADEVDLTPTESDEYEDADDKSSTDDVSKRRRRGTVLNLIMLILHNNGSPLTTGNIIEEVVKRLNEDVPTSTVTNNLTRLVRGGALKRFPSSDNLTSYYGLAGWFDENTLKPEFRAGRAAVSAEIVDTDFVDDDIISEGLEDEAEIIVDNYDPYLER